jgi:hypothetical protein
MAGLSWLNTGGDTMATTSVVTPAARTGPQRGPAVGVFVAVVALWLAFAVTLIADPGRLDDLWGAIQGLWLPVRAVVWLVFLPWVGALWVWQWPWPLALRLLVVSGLGLATLVAFYPRAGVGAGPAAGR